MKILPFRNLFVGIIDTLAEVFFEGKYADKELERVLKSNRSWGARDRAFIAETVYDLVRWKRLVEGSMSKPLSRDTLWEFVGTWFIMNMAEEQHLPSWDEFRHLNPKEIIKRHHQSAKNPAVAQSFPDWLYALGEKELGEQWIKEVEALNQQAPTVIRVNTLKIDRKSLHKELKENKIKTHILSKFQDALELDEKMNIFRTDAFQNGFFEVQDAGSQLIAPFLRVEPGQRVIDACAGAGGKTLHLASLMKNKGQIIAMDIHEWKLKELKKRAKRNNVQNVQTRLIESKTIKRMEESCDRLLIDAPCSGLGVLKRNPDAKWKLQPEFIENIKNEQAKILDSYSKMVKKGGLMVYATCSILPSENQEQVEKFLANHPEYTLILDKQYLPSEYGYDGFYMALMERRS
ncbi:MULTISPECIES: RsmB/NOP family class I SAM-dependent RNA methyltransferase [Weeksella]|uniref:Fmu (Sun) domain protein n=1 Tax=Weeksella virosa (strain ATCC 43766 / DSM 16922 / JCM 21250 / CCUG 30538 / CDC 9751 / IAM 14551 / NBRC 16016 / NCTC 11634 / CL345/78) TaxID=865938 RepID=F0NZH7_WEEVC|nr:MULTISPECIES: methyltransferase domain-containing protein [Weeksella]ADX68324.1 Fmu (Sun) domain protein [Weeksella virosa DSM 16922]MDK7674718.1 methyltransferase domain-containing protein [Weeksella virosa]OFM83111.1 RNA methyltransferase [Weeksella sp. HMSC059D05]SUP54643.1 Ribosomal RNA small subunit methyltransferase B [Weeksella virosa]VEH64035.1 Ribosomal RNA small subunit methyltransferase B [Weeksella virosa]